MCVERASSSLFVSRCASIVLQFSMHSGLQKPVHRGNKVAQRIDITHGSPKFSLLALSHDPAPATRRILQFIGMPSNRPGPTDSCLSTPNQATARIRVLVLACSVCKLSVCRDQHTHKTTATIVRHEESLVVPVGGKSSLQSSSV